MSEVTDLFGAQELPVLRAMGSHQSNAGGQDEWLTPPEIVAALGPFDLDPCAPVARPWDTAARHYTIEDNGLSRPWSGMVWLNPPYANASRWMARMADHRHGIALLFARTETRMWARSIWPYASLLMFLEGRLRFHHFDGRRAGHTSGAPSALIAFGDVAADRLRGCGLPGHIVRPGSSALSGGGEGSGR